MLIDFDVFGEKQLSREILRTSERTRDLTPAWRMLGEFVENIEERQFGSEGRFASGGWAPLATSTLDRKRAAGLDLRILHATLALRESLTGKTDDSIRLYTPNSFAFGTTLPYARYHQSGTFKMPRRRVIEFTRTGRREAVQIVQRYIVTGVARP